MIFPRSRILAGALASSAAALAMVSLSSCGFSVWVGPVLPICSEFDEAELSGVTADPPSVVFEAAGTLQVLHGRGQASASGHETVQVEQSAELPAYATQAAVFLNGWHSAYSGGDRHLSGVGTMIARIDVQPGKVIWRAAGGMSDASGDTPAFTWDYSYTIIAWNEANLRLMVDQSDADRYCRDGAASGEDNFFAASNEQAATAVLTTSSFLENPGFATGRSVAVVPRGYGFLWDENEDHHLLQLGYNLESAASFVRDQPYAKAAYTTINPLASPGLARAGGYASWKTSAVMKDNAWRRSFAFTELVSGLGGSDLEVLQPEYHIHPAETVQGAAGGAGLKVTDIVVENLPYGCAIPVLTGWEIGYTRDDQHVKELGIWIEKFSYDRPVGAAAGTLRYTVASILRDNDDYPDNYFMHKVTILGLEPLDTKGRAAAQEPTLGVPMK